MKVRVSYTVDIDEDLRRAFIREFGNAKRETIRDHLQTTGTSSLEDVGVGEGFYDEPAE